MDLGDGISTKRQFIPYMLSPEHAQRMFTGCSDKTKEHGKNLINSGWKFFATKQDRGRCYYREKVITIPAWVIDSPREGYKEYYICHEMSHAILCIAKIFEEQHGLRFMNVLKEICPPEYIHYEIEYKPRNAVSAGIGKKDSSIPEIDF